MSDTRPPVDYIERTRAHTDEVENLIQSGAFDSFDRTRPELMWRLHLLRGPKRRPPRGDTRREYGDLDPNLLAACRETPESREHGPNSGGWGQRGIAVTNQLAPGGEASLFPTPQTPALALPRLPDLDPERSPNRPDAWRLLACQVLDGPFAARTVLCNQPVHPRPDWNLVASPGDIVALELKVKQAEAAIADAYAALVDLDNNSVRGSDMSVLDDSTTTQIELAQQAQP